jgi:peptide/nickel transport system permease protein
MTTYILRRLLQALVLMFLLSIMFFLMARFQPGGPCPDLNIGCIQAQHLDEPVTNQYYFWVSQLVRFDFGLDASGQPVSQVISQKLPATILLAGTAVFFQQLIALPLGILAATRQYSFFDQGLTFFSYVALSIPSFVMGIVLVNLLGLHFGWFPTSRYEDVAAPILFSSDWWGALVTDPGYILGDLARHLFLPVLVLTAAGVAVDSRFMRASMLQTLHQDYIRTAKAKGVGRRSIVFKHAFRNALLPVLTNFGLYVPSLLGGVIVVELVFQWEGLGYAFGSAIGIGSLGGGSYGVGASSGDFGFIEATLMLATMVVLLANLLVDLAYVWLDPRIRFAARGEV